MEEFKHVFFKPHVGDNHQNRLILLSTIWCPHNEDNEKPCPFYNDCTGGNSRGHNNECCYPNGKGNDEYKPLDMSFIYLSMLFLEDKYTKYEERKNRTTYLKLTKAISAALPDTQYEDTKEYRKNIWSKFIITETCHHFTKQSETLPEDFDDNDFLAFIELIEKYDIQRVMVCGKYSYHFLHGYFLDNPKNGSWEQYSIDDYWHKVTIMKNGKVIRTIDLLFTYHPSYSGYYDNDENGDSKLVMRLKEFFKEDEIKNEFE